MLPLPEPYLLNEVTNSDFIYPRSKHYPLTESYDNGGVALRDPSKSLTDYIWKAWTDGTDIYCQRIDTNDVIVLISDTNITELDLTFDQNMNPCVAYVADGISKLYWYDTAQAQQVTTVFTDMHHPRVSLDDKRRINVSNSDIILAYQNGDNLCCRIQRDRYLIEYILTTDPKKSLLWRIGLGKNNRFLFYWR